MGHGLGKRQRPFLVIDVQFEVLARQRAISLSFIFSCFQKYLAPKKSGSWSPRTLNTSMISVIIGALFLTLPFSMPFPGPANRFEHSYGCPS